MLSWLLTKTLNSLRRFAVPVKCASCGHKFVPFADEELRDWRQLMGRFPCPKCGYRFGIGEDAEQARDNPPGPFDQPQESRIERRELADGSLLFYLPPSGHWGGLLLFTFIWTLGIMPLFYKDMIQHTMFPREVLGPHIFLCVFAAVGVVLIYASFHQRFASYLVHLGPEYFRLRHNFILRTTKVVPNAAIDSIWRVTAYSNATARRGSRQTATAFTLELRAGMKVVRFGSALSPDEQHWLAAEIRTYLRAHGATEMSEEVPKRLGRRLP